MIVYRFWHFLCHWWWVFFMQQFVVVFHHSRRDNSALIIQSRVCKIHDEWWGRVYYKLFQIILLRRTQNGAKLADVQKSHLPIYRRCHFSFIFGFHDMFTCRFRLIFILTRNGRCGIKYLIYLGRFLWVSDGKWCRSFLEVILSGNWRFSTVFLKV